MYESPVYLYIVFEIIVFTGKSVGVHSNFKFPPFKDRVGVTILFLYVQGVPKFIDTRCLNFRRLMSTIVDVPHR